MVIGDEQPVDGFSEMGLRQFSTVSLITKFTKNTERESRYLQMTFDYIALQGIKNVFSKLFGQNWIVIEQNSQIFDRI